MKKTEIVLLGTLHGLHTMNSSYTFEDVFKIIDASEPDLIAVEIRPEDVGRERDYLKKLYPYEMIEAAERYSKIMPVYGFDWLGDEIAGVPVPDKFFEGHIVKKLEAELEANTSADKAELEKIDAERMCIIQTGTASECNDGRYDTLTEKYYALFEELYAGKKYGPIIELYRNRDINIGRNIINIIKANQGKKTVFLMGMDHRVFALKNIKAQFGNEILIRKI